MNCPAKAYSFCCIAAQSRAAGQGHANAQYQLAEFYDEDGQWKFGIALSENYVKAAQWYQKAAEQGYADAQLELGKMYLKGQGVLKDDLKAARLFRKVAEQGNTAAQIELAWLYLLGLAR